MTVTLVPTAAPAGLPPIHPPWCNNCHDEPAFVMHATTTTVEVTPELLSAPTAVVEVEMQRVDEDPDADGATAGPVVIQIDVSQAETLTYDHANMTPEQARKLAAALVLMADMAETADRELAALLKTTGEVAP